jgi:leucyl aminopeptidase
MKFTLNTTSAPEIDTPCLVIGVLEKTPLSGSARLVDDSSGGELSRLIESGDVSTDWKDTTVLHGLDGVKARRIVVLGFGEPDKYDAVRYDLACLSAGAFLRDHVTTSAHVCIHEIAIGEDNSEEQARWRLRQAAVSLARANYRYTATKPAKDHDHPPLESASFNAGESYRPTLDEARGLATAYHRATELGNLPPNICNPAYLAGIAQEFADRYDNVSVDILGPGKMAELKMSALLAVGQGSANGQRLIVLSYRGLDDLSKPVVHSSRAPTWSR